MGSGEWGMFNSGGELSAVEQGVWTELATR